MCEAVQASARASGEVQMTAFALMAIPRVVAALFVLLLFWSFLPVAAVVIGMLVYFRRRGWLVAAEEGDEVY